MLRKQLYFWNNKVKYYSREEDATDEEIAEAAKNAVADEFIENENKYDSVVSQGGTNLSGGQKQRLALIDFS